jgi:hypothetical protein
VARLDGGGAGNDESVGFVGLWMAGRLTGGQAVGASLGTIIGSILSGATAYGSGVNVGLGAERLEVAANLARDLPDSPQPRTGES